MTGIHISQLAFFRRDQNSDQRHEFIRAEGRESHRDALHDGDGLEPIDVRRMERALHNAGEHCRRDAVPGYIRNEQCGPLRAGGIVVEIATKCR